METYSFIYNLLDIKGIGRVKANKILYSFKDKLNQEFIDKQYLYNNLKNHLSKDQTEKVITGKFDFKEHLSTNIDKEIKFLNIYNNKYPEELREFLKNNSPTILSYAGNLNLLRYPKIGFCGSRKASDKGLKTAEDIADQVTHQNIVNVSGYASGIDQKVHFTSLKNGGSTIIVLPEGINRFRIKRNVKDVWDWERVLVISEFLPNDIWTSNRAMQRNSTIIALSNAMILIEAGERGGSIDAGYKTLKMGKNLFTPIYEGMPKEAIGNQILLNKGATKLMKRKKTGRANLDRLFETINDNKDSRLPL
jgi:DNA processing protein